MTSAEGLGFAIPINIIKPVLTQVVTGGTFIPVYVGITGMDIETYEMLYGVDLMADYGVIIIETMKDSPARKPDFSQMMLLLKLTGKRQNIWLIYKKNYTNIKMEINRNLKF